MDKNMNFQIYDYVIEKYSKEVHQILEIFDTEIRVHNLRSDVIYSSEYSDFELWKPEKDEFCIFFTDKSVI